MLALDLLFYILFNSYLTDVGVDHDSSFGVNLNEVNVEVVLGQGRVPKPGPDLDCSRNFSRKFVDLTPGISYSRLMLTLL